MTAAGKDHPPCILVLPRFPHRGTGTGQRSLMLVEAAAKCGPLHIVLLDGTGQTEDLTAIDGVASVHVMHSERITPTGRLAAKLLGLTRLLMPKRAYRADPALNNELEGLLTKTGARRIIFRYIRTFTAAGITARQGLSVYVDVDDRDDQKYATQLEQQAGPKVAGSVLARNRVSALRRVLIEKLEQADLVWFAAPEDVLPLNAPQTAILANVVFTNAPEPPVPATGTDPVALFVGIHAHMPNRNGVVWFLENCWADIRVAIPDARLRIVGRGNWIGMAQDYATLEGVDFVGPVDDLGPEYAGARLCLCPVHEGGGSKIKVVEAAAFARPIVGTPHAGRGFNPEFAALLRCSAEAEAFIAYCVAYLKDAGLAAKDGAAVHKAQQAHYSRKGAHAIIIDGLRSSRSSLIPS